jgi:hypothetical protein
MAARSLNGRSRKGRTDSRLTKAEAERQKPICSKDEEEKLIEGARDTRATRTLSAKSMHRASDPATAEGKVQ